MKKLLFFSIAFSIIAVSCTRYPNARFTVNYSTVQPFEIIQFTNLSNDAVSYEWNFGDGTIKTTPNPTHYYEEEGDYVVTLTAISSEGKRDLTSMTIHALYTWLDITVAEWNPDEIIEYTVPDALVILYASYSDWLHDQNQLGTGITDAYGEVSFYNLDPIRYWVWVEADDIWETGDHYDNYDFYDFDPDYYLSTAELIPFAINTWVAWADYFPPTKTAKEKRTVKVENTKIKTGKRTLLDDEDVTE